MAHLPRLTAGTGVEFRGIQALLAHVEDAMHQQLLVFPE
jgi:hypothetical protein